MTCETGFRVAGLRLCGTQAKVFLRGSNDSNGVVAAVYEESEKRLCVWTCEGAL